ncbi:DUF6428 family protein [Mucilaginibacter ginkgonis]|uniref:Uncharacterized protein n=1 Tax=Mucilaginibacter ginkgonis TaxID=2682091 RepID=A0A6I4I3N9_9SPHI|nr:DUF6428 family protein [Mucilaginibacter ginkgonis]QQL49158.1 hypothetical protein GO620_013365 [Mucilaginibacter ginkgonis]
MNVKQLKRHLAEVCVVNFKLPDGTYLPKHFHVTEVGLIDKHFVDCGGVQRKEQKANFQLWEDGDYDHRLAPQKFLHILDLSNKILGSDELDIEVEYQQNTIGKFDLGFDGHDFLLIPKYTACLAKESCGVPQKTNVVMSNLLSTSNCQPGGGCC